MKSHPLFEIVTTTTGAISIRNKEVNEIMHNPVGPWAEANALYVEQSRLSERLLNGRGEFVVYDVGLGAASNAIAALSCTLKIPSDTRRPLRLVSFEREMELLHFALENADQFPHYEGFVGPVQTLLSEGAWEGEGVYWELQKGDFLELIEHQMHRPHLIFFDPYSPEVNQDMWTMNCFGKIRKMSRESDQEGTLLYTYSQATRIRVALLVSGFHVGYGQATGLKNQTTEASTDRHSLRQPLDEKWFRRWQRSHIRYPFDCSVEDQGKIDELVRQAF